MKNPSPRLILASTSPRRREILELLGLTFEVVAPDCDEVISRHRSAEEEALKFAVEKAGSVARKHPASLVIGSDTMILLGTQKIGKPEGPADARRILAALSGKIHTIFTGVAIIDGTGGPGLKTVEEVSVKMRGYSEKEIEDYLLYKESDDKAGAYSIQGKGSGLIESIEGDYLAAVGLPLRPIAGYLKSRGIVVPADVDKLYAGKSFRNRKRF